MAWMMAYVVVKDLGEVVVEQEGAEFSHQDADKL